MSEHHKIFAALTQFDTPTVCNVIELLDIRSRDSGFVDGSISALFPEMPPIVGFATTAKFKSSKPDDDEPAYGGLGEQVEEFVENVPAPRVVVFEDVDEEPVGATFGEVMCSVYKSYGCAGLITSGGARDLDQVQALGFPCWASQVIASHAYCRIIEHGEPVTVGGCRIETGDVIHADANGITTIPLEHCAAVAEACREMMEAENEILHLVRGHTPSLQDFAAARKRCADRIAALSTRLKNGE